MAMNRDQGRTVAADTPQITGRQAAE
jgi:hypothetical protein